MQKSAQLLLRPFSHLYGGITRLRNYLYDHKLLASRRFDLPVIAVGNLTVGGTGKTPHVEYLLRLLSEYKLATLSRGYKRQSKGFILADAQATPSLIGDEPFQYHADFKQVSVAVCEQRVKGIAELQARLPGLEVVVLDDAMQHRPVQPSLNILISDYNRPFYRDHVLPAGRLREPRNGAARADVVIVSKCPATLGEAEMEQVRQQVRRYALLKVPVCFSTFSYGQPVPIGGSGTLAAKVILVTGIANARPLRQYLQERKVQVLEHLEYPDHHAYTPENLDQLASMLQKQEYAGASILTTRKDAVKLTDAALDDKTKQLPVFYVPIEVRFLAEQAAFDSLVLRHVQEFS